MSVGFDFRVDIRPYSGYSDISLPIASWHGEAGAVGDASGGIINMDFLFQRDDDAQISELFNLEALTMDIDADPALEWAMSTTNMDSFATHRPATDRVWKVTMGGIGALSISAGAALNSPDILPIWLGSPNRNEGDAGLRFRTSNVLNRLYFVQIEGMMWGPRSVLADGGPRRPVGGGLYGA